MVVNKYSRGRNGPRERGILKPKGTNSTKQRGIFDKLQTFFKRYSLNEYENDTNVDNLQNSIDISGLNGYTNRNESFNDVKRPVTKKLRYDDEIKYEPAPLPNLQESTRRMTQMDHDYNEFKKRQDEKRRNERLRQLHQPEDLAERSGYQRELARKDERLRSLERSIRETRQEVEDLKQQLHDALYSKELLMSKTHQLNKQLIRVNELNFELNNKFDQLNHQYEIVISENNRLALENQDIKTVCEHHVQDFLQLQLQLVDKTYQAKLRELQFEFDTYQLTSNPQMDAKLVYYSQIAAKLAEYKEYFYKFHQLKSSSSLMFLLDLQWLHRDYDYESLTELKVLLLKLSDKLHNNFQKKSHKPLTVKLINHLSLIHQLKVECVQLLQTVDEILIILSDAH